MKLTDVLRGGRQCDEDGVEIIMSRQACCEAAERIEALEAALAELVALKDLKTRLEKLHAMGHGTDYTDYHRCKPLAWQKARELLTPNFVLRDT